MSAPRGIARRISGAREFAAGVGTLFGGFRLWRRRPRLMLFGLVPALIVGVVLATLIGIYLANAGTVVRFLTPFADDWIPLGRDLLRIVLGLALLVGLLAGSVLGFTALTLVVGDPFYERIWRAVEDELGDPGTLVEPPFWRAVADSATLVGRGAILSLGSFAIGLLPLVGTPAALVLGAWFGGRNLATELTARPLEARGLDRTARAALLRRRPARVAGFGIATHLLFLVPGGAVAGMAAAVAGGTALARELLPGAAPADEAPASGPAPER